MLVRFLSYTIAALQTLEPAIGSTALGALQASQAQPPTLEPLLISLVNDISAGMTGEYPCILVLDDYHVIKQEAIHESWTICSITYRLTYAWSSPREKIPR
jgi:LuxR family transcriptional regulator, maltose regulon positive regulatory protein